MKLSGFTGRLRCSLWFVIVILGVTLSYSLNTEFGMTAEPHIVTGTPNGQIDPQRLPNDSALDVKSQDIDDVLANGERRSTTIAAILNSLDRGHALENNGDFTRAQKEFDALVPMAKVLGSDDNTMVRIVVAESRDAQFFDSLTPRQLARLDVAAGAFRASSSQVSAEQQRGRILRMQSALDAWEAENAGTTIKFAEMLLDISRQYLITGDRIKSAQASKRAREISYSREGESPINSSAIVHESLAKSDAGDFVGAYLDACRARRSLVQYRHIVGKASPALCDCLGFMAAYASDLGDKSRSVQLQEQAIEAASSCFGKESDQWFEAVGCLGKSYYTNGDYGTAERLLGGIIKHFDDRGDFNSGVNLFAKIDLARVYTKTNRVARSESLLRSTLIAASHVPYGRRAIVRDGLFALGELHTMQEDYILADLCLKESLAELEAAHGSDNPRCVNVVKCRAVVLRQLGELEEAKKADRRATEFDQKIAEMRAELDRTNWDSSSPGNDQKKKE